MEKGLFYGFLAIVVVIVGATGILLGVEISSNQPHLREAPSPPPAINDSSAPRYAEKIEKTKLHNRILNNTSPDRIEIGCNSRSVVSTSENQYVFVQCAATTYDDGSVSDGVPRTVLYRISPAGYTRAEQRGTQAESVQSDTTSLREFQPVPLLIYNFGERNSKFDIIVTVVNSSTGIAGTEYTESVESESGLFLDTVFKSPGKYRVKARTAESVTTDTWTLDNDRQRLMILAGPNGLQIEATRVP
ncbi:hypothetical protein [Haloarcula salina]|uniref:Uncharacterized protein n=1 Tax=Haloarcula salina TaxID=1429914 RepID=A0AA41KGB1_9EURY|nr:hypothetical protein [Haloarcula salina]MBV0902922.1 hypothetical protein [Haloarcula salina]